MSRKLVGITLVIMLLLLVLPGAVSASTDCKPCKDVSGDIGLVPQYPSPSPSVVEPNVPSDWIRFRGFSNHHLTMTVGQSRVITLDVPSELAPYTITYQSQDTAVATIVANSPARVTATGLGETWVLAVVQTDERTYYDAVLVEVVDPSDLSRVAGVGDAAAPDAAVATPSTAGGKVHSYLALVGIMVLTFGLVALRRSSLES